MQVKEEETTPLCAAVRLGSFKAVSDLINDGAEIDEIDSLGWSPLMLSVTDLVSLFIDHGADLRPSGDYTPPTMAARDGHTHIVELFLDRGGMHINATTEDGVSLLHEAVKGKRETAEFLIRRGADIDLLDDDRQWCPLMSAIRNDHLSTANLLVKCGALVSNCAFNGLSPLILSAESEDDAIAKLLLEYGASAHTCDDEGWSPLMAASTPSHPRTRLIALFLEEVTCVSTVLGRCWFVL